MDFESELENMLLENEMIENLKQFCANPTNDVFQRFPRHIKEFFYKLSNYVINKNTGNTDLALKILDYYYYVPKRPTKRTSWKNIDETTSVKKTIPKEQEYIPDTESYKLLEGTEIEEILTKIQGSIINSMDELSPTYLNTFKCLGLLS